MSSSIQFTESQRQSQWDYAVGNYPDETSTDSVYSYSAPSPTSSTIIPSKKPSSPPAHHGQGSSWEGRAEATEALATLYRESRRRVSGST